MPERKVLFGVGLGEWSGANLSQTSELVQTAVQADREELDIFLLPIIRTARIGWTPTPLWGSCSARPRASTGRSG